ncbi:hypothetical protein E2C01_057373 [Portunus trituberculatus]|uniref:Uncharacterized protein n=1 Tax=Portunus trituberculatus TaxID=210409 RepID=A0A5B7H1P9_PORTR|nr:hypothetical protein [Portunus trituberculatus]
MCNTPRMCGVWCEGRQARLWLAHAPSLRASLFILSLKPPVLRVSCAATSCHFTDDPTINLFNKSPLSKHSPTRWYLAHV